METDLRLLNAAQQMNQDALIKIFELYASALYNYALRLCGDSLLADHIVGDVFVKLLEQFASGKGPTSNLRSYLYETAYHILIDEARSSSRRAPLEVVASIKSDAGSGSPGVEDKLMLEMILGAVQHNLNDDQRHVIILRFLEGFSLRETAAILGKDVSHVKVIQTRGLAKLRNIFATNENRTTAALPRGVRNCPMT